MENVMIRDTSEADFEAIAELNADEIQYTSAMDLERLHHLHVLADYHRVAVVDDEIAAFLIAMKDHASYKNENFAWFLSRYTSFLYIDRVVVGQKYQGRGIGSLLYEDIFQYAKEEKIPFLTCEINVVPLNRKSHIFHLKHGFREVGSQWVAGGQKKVAMLVAKPGE